jgi:hypothetical protein
MKSKWIHLVAAVVLACLFALSGAAGGRSGDSGAVYTLTNSAAGTSGDLQSAADGR